MLHSLQIDLLLAHTIAIIIFSMTGRTKAEKDGVWIAKIMVGVGCMQKNDIAFSCALGFAPFPLRDMAKLAFPSCSFLTLSG